MKELLRPRWVVAHLVILALAATCVALGLWQVRRLHEKQAFNARLLARTSEPVVALSTLFPSAAFDQEQIDRAAYRRVTVTGQWRTEEELLLLSRTRNTLAGHHLLTPLQLDAGYKIVVDRGWIPFRTYTLPVAEAAPPAGEVTVTGVLFPTVPRGRFGPRDAPGHLDGIWRIDVARIAEQVDGPVFPLWLQIERQDPPQSGELPKSIELPRLEEGPHRSYAIQWFSFALIGLVGYGVIIRKRVRAVASGDGVPDEAADRR